MSDTPRLCDLHGPDSEPEERESAAKAKPGPKPRRSSGTAKSGPLDGEAKRYREAGQRGENRFRFREGGGELERAYGGEGLERLRAVLEREGVERVDVDVSVVEN